MFKMLGGGDAKVRPMSPDDAITKLAAGEILLIDVRESAELQATGIADGAIHIPLGEIAERLAPETEGHPAGLLAESAIVLYCGAGVRAGKAGDILTGMGYENVFNIGGFGDWQAAGGPVRAVGD